LALVIKTITPGSKIAEACIAGDKLITEKTGKIYKTGKVEKGVAFPTSISVNNTVGHFSPLPDHKAAFASGDLVKIDLGVHVDGYVAVAAHSFVLGVEEPTGKAADVLACAYTAADAAFRLLKPGTKNTAITEVINKTATEFKCNAVQGVLSHQMKRFVIDGDKVILNRSDVDQKVDEFEFAPNEVFAIDIVMSTGAGKPNEVDERTTIYKRAPDTTYNLKRKVSRLVFSDIVKKHAVFPFNLRDLDTKLGKEAEKEIIAEKADKPEKGDKPEKEKKGGQLANFAIKECVEHELVHPYPVLYEKTGELVAHVKFTALLLPSGTIKITGVAFDRSKLKTSVVVKDEGLLKALSSSSAGGAAKKKKKKNNKKKKPAGGGADAEKEKSGSTNEPMDTS